MLGTSQPCSLDFLAFGYLALMIFPNVPQAWLKETILTKFPRLATYVHKLRKTILTDEEVNAAQVWAFATKSVPSASPSKHLPWIPRPHSFVHHTFTGLREFLGNTPVVSSLVRHNSVPPAEPLPFSTRTVTELLSPTFVNTILGLTTAAVVGLASLAIQHRRSPREGDLIFWTLRPAFGLGDAGNIFSVLGQLTSGELSRF